MTLPTKVAGHVFNVPVSLENRHGKNAPTKKTGMKIGVTLVWVVVPDTQKVHVHRINGTTQTLRGDDELSGEDVVPGFKCRLPELFAFDEADETPSP